MSAIFKNRFRFPFRKKSGPRRDRPLGQWLPWLEDEFGWAERTARRYMEVAEAFKSATLADLTIDATALYARPETAEGR
jgi:hypothetical protein